MHLHLVDTPFFHAWSPFNIYYFREQKGGWIYADQQTV